MTLQLQIWGPAFSLPSIDPQCLTALAYLSILAKQEALQWQLVASSNPSISPSNELPALLHKGTSITGLENIIHYLDVRVRSRSLSSSLDNSPSRLADLAAFTSHILHHGPPLLALSLLVSTENYTAVTRPAYSALLPWPAQYIIPPHLRSKAKAQTANSGLTSPDLVDDDQDSDAAGRRYKSIIPESLRTLGSSSSNNKKVTSALNPARFRLDALVDDFCAPLNELLEQDEAVGKRTTTTKGKPTHSRNKYLLSSSSRDDHDPENDNDNNNNHDNPTSLDCLATAYLSLMLHPSLPQDWLASRIQQRWPSLATYTANMGDELWGGQQQENYTTTLPWRIEPPQSWSWMAGTVAASSIMTEILAFSASSIPGLGWGPAMTTTTGVMSGYPPASANSASTSTSTLPADANPDADGSAGSTASQRQPHDDDTLPDPNSSGNTVLLTATATAAALAAAAAVLAAAVSSGYGSGYGYGSLALPYLSQSEEGGQESGTGKGTGARLSEMGEAGRMLSGMEVGSF